MRAELQDSIREEWFAKSVDDLNVLAHRYMKQNRTDSAMMVFVIMGNKYDPGMSEAQRRTAIYGLNNAGALCTANTNDYLTGYRYLRRAYELAKSNGFVEMIPDIEMHLASVYTLFDDQSREAQEIYRQSFSKARDLNKYEVMVLAFINLIVTNYTGDIEEFADILSDKMPGNTPKLSFARHLYKGIDLMRKNQYSLARDEFKNLRENNYDSMDSLRSETLLTKMIAESYMKEMRPDSAIHYYQQMLTSAAEVEMHPYEIEATKMLRECYGLLGDTATRDLLHLRYLEKKDSLIEVNQVAQLNSLRQKDDIESIELRMNDLANRKRNQEIIGFASIVLAVMLLLFLIFLWNRNKKLRSVNRFLYNKTQEMMADASKRRAEMAALKNTKEQEEPKESNEKQKPGKYHTSNLQDEEILNIEQKISQKMKNTSVICDPNFSLNGLAQSINSNTAYVSRVINERFGVSFSILLGDNRIKEAILRMNDSSYGHLTIEAISQSVGFRSKTTFINSFKRVTGLTPSEYLKEAKAQKH